MGYYIIEYRVIARIKALKKKTSWKAAQWFEEALAFSTKQQKNLISTRNKICMKLKVAMITHRIWPGATATGGSTVHRRPAWWRIQRVIIAQHRYSASTIHHQLRQRVDTCCQRPATDRKIWESVCPFGGHCGGSDEETVCVAPGSVWQCQTDAPRCDARITDCWSLGHQLQGILVTEMIVWTFGTHLVF